MVDRILLLYFLLPLGAQVIPILDLLLLLASRGQSFSLLDFSRHPQLFLADGNLFLFERGLTRLNLRLRRVYNIKAVLMEILLCTLPASQTLASRTLSSLLLIGDLALTVLLELEARELLLLFIAHAFFKLLTLALSLGLLLLHGLHVALEGINAMLQCLHVLLLLLDVGLLGEHD